MDDFLGHLPKAVRENIKKASEVEKVLYPTASRTLNHALGGGIGKGRVALIYGNYSSGKSLLAMQSIGEWQKQGLLCAYVDVEGGFEPGFAERLGVDCDDLIVIDKKSTGAVTDSVVPLLEAGIDILVIDSISVMLPEVFLDKDGGVAEFDKMKQIGAHAKSVSMMINAMLYANKNTSIVIISQTTTQINQTYVKQVPHGGMKLPFACSQIIRLMSSATEANQIMGQTFIGNKIIQRPIGRPVQAVVEKNKLGPQSRTAEWNIYYDGPKLGIDAIEELATMAEGCGAIQKSGAWFYFGDDKWHGKQALVDALRENPELETLVEAETHLLMTGEAA